MAEVVEVTRPGLRQGAVGSSVARKEDDRLLRGAQQSEAGPVLARDRQRKRIVPLGPGIGETNLHERQSLEEANVRRAL